MKPLILFALLMLVGCGRVTNEDLQCDLRTFDYKGCKYLVYENRPYTNRFAITHAGDCPNPKHGEGRP